MIRKLSAFEVAIARGFAKKRLENDGDLYSSRGAKSADHIFSNIFNGTLAEVAVFNYIKEETSRKVTCPDLRIYGKSEKSFGGDIKLGKTPIHIKSVTKETADRYGASWVFQKQDYLTKKTDDEIICFCIVGESAVKILGFFWSQDLINEGAFEKPKNKRQQQNKKAIYINSLKKLHPISI